jgi:nucleoside 2-deoxyribosyltransferase
MWIHGDLDIIYADGFQAGILKAGYNPIRIDRLEHVNRIDDEIIRQLKASKFLVADFTGHRGGVYFEAGFALGHEMPVFWTCRKDDMDNLHFDIRQFNCIDWQTPEELAERLSIRLEAVLGPGPNKL